MKRLVQIIFIILVLFNISLAENIDNANISLNDINQTQILTQKQIKFDEINTLLKDNIWIKRYNNYITYRKIQATLEKLKRKYKQYSRWKGAKYKELAYQLSNKIKIKQNELKLISEYRKSPIGSLISPETIEKVPKVTNPFMIFEAINYIDKLKQSKKSYKKIYDDLKDVLLILKEKKQLLKDIVTITKDKNQTKKLKFLAQEAKDLTNVVDIVSTTYEVYDKKIEQLVLDSKKHISNEIKKTFRIAFVVVVLLLLAIIIKILIKKYAKHDNDDHHYTTNKLINFIFVVIVIIVLLFSYIDNASYLVTFLGFASAGIAIALKDWFMSLFGWMAIMISGSIKVGDRIKVTKNGTEAVGDVLDISLLKISIREDITLTSYMKNRRTGRVFFIPNSYIFTDLIANYTYDKLQTVWDGIDIAITFDSNSKRAVELAREITKRHAKVHTDSTRKSLNKMRKKYVLRSTGVEPRIFAFVESYGIVISSWYFTTSYATLSIRSNISIEILQAFLDATDIHIAYPTQTLKHSSSTEVPSEVVAQPSGVGLF